MLLPTLSLLVACVVATSLDVQRFGPDDALFTVMIVCGLHPREAITRDVCETWVRTLAVHPPAKMHVVIVPNANPQGVERWHTDECWRGNGRGVDLNRNWPPVDCDQRPPDAAMYTPLEAEQEWSHGTAPLSEWETRELHALMHETQPHLLLAIHSGIEAFLTPYDACARSPRNYLSHVKLAKWLRRDICDECVVARSPRLLYFSQGTMTDYAYHHVGVPLVFTVELFAGPEPDDLTHCAQLFSPPAHTPAYTRVVLRWRRMIKRLIDIDTDDYLALLEMAEVVDER